MNEKPYPMPGTTWCFRGDKVAPPMPPRTVVYLRWFADRTEAVFGESCADVEHMMRLDAWECVQPEPVPEHALNRAQATIERLTREGDELKRTIAELRDRQPAPAERVTAKELAEVARLNVERFEHESEHMRTGALRVLQHLGVSLLPKLAAEVTALRADMASCNVTLADEAARIDDLRKALAAAGAKLEALREKARAVCHARRFPATLQHEIDALGAEVERP